MPSYNHHMKKEPYLEGYKTMSRICFHRSKIITTVLLWLSLDVASSWSLMPISPTQYHSNDRIEKARSLLHEVKNGKSYVHPGISVVSVGGEECGIQLHPQVGGIIGEDDDVIFVDRSEFLTPESGLETPVGQALQWYLSQAANSGKAHSEKLPHIHLAIYLALYKQGLLLTQPTKTTMNYLDTLPTSHALEHLPLFWDEPMLEELQCSVVKQAVKTRRDEWKQEFLLIQSAMDAVGLPETFRLLDQESWYWARSIITSRAFTDYDNNNYPCLCPYVDMMNHISGQQLQDSDEVLQCIWEIDSKGYHLRLPKSEAEGEGALAGMKSPRLEISYGSHSNAHFLMNYGFSILDDNDQALEEAATLPVMLPDFVHEQETELLWEADGLGDCHTIARNVRVGIGNAGPIESVLSMCRVASAQKLELSRMKENFQTQGCRTKDTEDGLVPQLGATLCREPFSVANEIRALKMLRSAAEAALGRYSTTMEQDTDMLKTIENRNYQGDRNVKKPLPRAWLSRLWSLFWKQSKDAESSSLFGKWRNAVTVRLGEKKILRHYLLLASIGLKFLERADEELFETYKGMLDATLHDPEPL